MNSSGTRRLALSALVLVVIGPACGDARRGDDGASSERAAPSTAQPTLVLRLDRDRVAPGATLGTALENRGRADLTAGTSYRLEQRVAGVWVDLPQGFFALIGYSLPAGGEHALTIRLPDGLIPGRYRLIREGSGGTIGGGRSATYSASAEFRVATTAPDD